MREEYNTFSNIEENERTRCLDETAPPALPLAPRPAFLIAFDRLAQVAAAASGPALVIAVVDPRARLVDACLVPDRTSLVIGRHTECGLRLSHPAIALRQIALLARSDGGQVHAHLWDLNTEQPFSTEDGATTSALVSDGPTFITVEEYALWIIPANVLQGLPSRAQDAWEALPKRHFLDRRGPDPERAASRRVAPEETDPLDLITHVVRTAPPLLVHDDVSPEAGWGVIRLQNGSQKTRHSVGAERLGRGLLLGRYDRCGLTVAGLDKLSRVHLLLVRIGDEAWAIDTASTNGVSHRGRRITAMVLGPQDELRLAQSFTMSWAREDGPAPRSARGSLNV